MPRVARGRTPSGKARSSQNALAHGLRSLVPIIPGVETEEEWQTHRQSIITSLAPSAASRPASPSSPPAADSHTQREPSELGARSVLQRGPVTA